MLIDNGAIPAASKEWVVRRSISDSLKWSLHSENTLYVSITQLRFCFQNSKPARKYDKDTLLRKYENSLLFVFSCTGMLFLRISLFHFHSWYTEFVICSSSKEIYASIVLPYVVASMIHKKMKQRGSAVIWQYRSHTYCFLLSILICSRFFRS